MKKSSEELIKIKHLKIISKKVDPTIANIVFEKAKSDWKKFINKNSDELPNS